MLPAKDNLGALGKMIESPTTAAHASKLLNQYAGREQTRREKNAAIRRYKREEEKRKEERGY